MTLNMLRTIATVLFVQALISPVSALRAADSSDIEKSSLTRMLEAELSRFPAKSGIYIKHLELGEEAGVLADEHFESASTIKVATMVLAYRMADAGDLDLDERVTLKLSDMRGGSGILRLSVVI